MNYDHCRINWLFGEEALTITTEEKPTTAPEVGVGEFVPTEKVEPIAEVEGYEGVVSNLYRRITKDNIDEIFQTPLPQFGPNVYGGKVVVYLNNDGEWEFAFMTETEKTHHRQALGKLVGGTQEQFLREGRYDQVPGILDRSFSWELQYDKSTGKLIGIDISGQITDAQISRNHPISKQKLDLLNSELLEKLVDIIPNEWLESDEPLDSRINIPDGLRIE